MVHRSLPAEVYTWIKRSLELHLLEVQVVAMGPPSGAPHMRWVSKRPLLLEWNKLFSRRLPSDAPFKLLLS